MSRTFTLFTAVVLALTALTAAAPAVDNNSVAITGNAVASNNIILEKRKKHHKNKHHKKDKKKSKKSKKSKKTKTSKSTTKKSGSGGSSSSGTYKGTATWFKPASEGGSQGACGPEENDNSRIVALNAPQYGSMSKKSSWCGKTITITGPTGKSTKAKINDACPGCDHGDLDLTPVLFKEVIGDMNKGVGEITWSLD
jgi:expansin (peptidoglycan-binding protein)